jgi:hypothetical protein
VSTEQTGESQPLLTVVSGQPSEDELAALTAVVVALAGASSDEPARPGGWSDLSLRLRRPLPHGPNAWRNSRWL